MKPIQIPPSPVVAATAAVRAVMSRSPTVRWLVRSISDEGYEMAPVSSREAQAWLRWFPECVAGEFSAMGEGNLPNALLSAKFRVGERSTSRTEDRREWERQYKRAQRAKKRAAA
jgi:hypothetical protein